jgi:glyoxylase-like metal-dependent hydrolase (beta-lactamase superfamily II)
MDIHRISVPTPFYVGPVNVYVIKDDPLTIIDTGPRMDEAITALRAGLNNLGCRISDVKRIVISHAHVDHFGLARLIQEESGATVLVHAWDAAAVTGLGDYAAEEALLAAAGVPPEALNRMQEGYAEFVEYGAPVEAGRIEVLKDEDDIEFEHESLTVIHTPGHTPGSICLLRKSNRLMFSADTVLKNITPNPVLNPDPIDPKRRFPSLGEYLVSLARIKSLAPTLLRGGHGDDVIDYEEYFTRLYRFTRLRQSRLLSLLPGEGATAWEAASRLFPNVRGHHRFLALSETVAHLDFAVEEGKLQIERGEGRDVYHLP